MDTVITKKNINEKFLVKAIEHGLAFANGDHKKANKLHKQLHDLYNKAREWNCANLFIEFLGNDNESVKLWAAIFTIKIDPEIAEVELLNLSKSSSITGLSAKTTLDLWKKGMLNLL